MFFKAELASPYHLMPTNTLALGLYERTVLKHTFRQTTDLNLPLSKKEGRKMSIKWRQLLSIAEGLKSFEHIERK